MGAYKDLRINQYVCIYRYNIYIYICIPIYITTATGNNSQKLNNKNLPLQHETIFQSFYALIFARKVLSPFEYTLISRYRCYRSVLMSNTFEKSMNIDSKERAIFVNESEKNKIVYF